VPEVPPPTEVLTLVFLAWTAGTAVVGAVTSLWGQQIQPGHFKVIWLVTAGLAIAAGFGFRPAWVVAGLALLAFVWTLRSAGPEMGIGAAGVSVGALAAGAPVYAFAAAALLGTVTNAMLLGHWHLNQPRLGTAPIARLVWALWGALVAFVAATGVVAISGTEGIASLGAVVALAFAVFCMVLTAMVHHLVRTRSIMSATGILYLEILLCLVAAFTGALAAGAAA
jgi:hypothetical protein